MLRTTLSNHDAILIPTNPTTAPVLGQDTIRLHEDVYEAIDLGTRLTVLASTVGFPAISIPCGFDRSGLPVGFQLIGAPNHDTDLLRIGEAYQAATTYHLAEPPSMNTQP